MNFEKPAEKISKNEGAEEENRSNNIPRELPQFITDLKNVRPELEELGPISEQLDRGELPTANEIEQAVDTLSQTALQSSSGDMEESRSLLSRLRELPASIRRTMIALTTALELLAASTAFAKTSEHGAAAESTQKESIKIGEAADEKPPFEIIEGEPAPSQPIHFTIGHNSVGITDDEIGIFTRHNIHRPESIADGLKMFVEPFSIHLNFKYDQESWVGHIIAGQSAEDPFTFTIDIPYEYAQDFQKASPNDQKKMQADFTARAKELLDYMLPTVFGPSFFREDIKNDIGPSNRMRLEKVTIEGSASGEATSRVDSNDPRNQRLSELRAENATNVIQKILQERGVSYDELAYRGVGETHMTAAERETLHAEAMELDIANPRTSEERAILALIEQYNDHKITDAEALKSLNEIVGSKRNVAIKIETDERPGVIVLPLPLLLIVGAIIIGPHPQKPSNYNIHMIPRRIEPSLAPSERELREARDYGQSQSPEIYGGRRGRLAKDYASPRTSSQQIVNEAAEAIHHQKHGALRVRAELGFQAELSTEERLRGLAAVLLRQIRSLNALERRGGRSRGDVDIFDAVEDRQTLARLLKEIVVPETFRMSDGRRLIAPIPSADDLVYPIKFTANRRRARSGEREEDSASSVNVNINARHYNINYARLQELAAAHH